MFLCSRRWELLNSGERNYRTSGDTKMIVWLIGLVSKQTFNDVFEDTIPLSQITISLTCLFFVDRILSHFHPHNVFLLRFILSSFYFFLNLPECSQLKFCLHSLSTCSDHHILSDLTITMILSVLYNSGTSWWHNIKYCPLTRTS